MQGLEHDRVSIRELLATFCNVIEELRVRGAVRSANSPVADYSQALVRRTLKLEPLKHSNKGYNAVDKAANKRYEIKGRRVTKSNRSTQLSVIRDLDRNLFDYLVGVLFDENFKVTHAYCIPHAVVKAAAGDRRKYVNGWIVHLKPSVWNRPGVRDITAEVQKAQIEWA